MGRKWVAKQVKFGEKWRETKKGVRPKYRNPLIFLVGRRRLELRTN